MDRNFNILIKKLIGNISLFSAASQLYTSISFHTETFSGNIFAGFVTHQHTRLVEEPAPSKEVAIDADRLKFFNSKLRIWDYAKISSSDYQKLSFKDKSSILKSYYVDMPAKYSLGTGINIIFCFLVEFSPVFAMLRWFFHVCKNV